MVMVVSRPSRFTKMCRNSRRVLLKFFADDHGAALPLDDLFASQTPLGRGRGDTAHRRGRLRAAASEDDTARLVAIKFAIVRFLRRTESARDVARNAATPVE